MRNGEKPEKPKKTYAALPGLLLPWYRANARKLPWRETREPYPVLVSEIMLQQTRVEAVLGYYTRFLQEFPDVYALASAPEDRLLKLWEGLGYYNRARNLQRAARKIVENGGDFPGNYEAIRALPGVGDYTADAVASICFGLPTPAVDGNVLRVASRTAALAACVDDAAVRRAVRQDLRAICPPDAGAFTQALMELGATVCLPNGAPLCAKCPLAGICAAHRQGNERAYPLKAQKKPRRIERRTVFLLALPDGRIALQKRPGKGLLAGLYELPNLLAVLSPQEALAQAAEWGVCPADFIGSRERTHIFTHIEWHMTCYRIACGAEGDFLFADPADYPLPGAFAPFLVGW